MYSKSDRYGESANFFLFYLFNTAMQLLYYALAAPNSIFGIQINIFTDFIKLANLTVK